MVLLSILWDVILPTFIVISFGFLLDRALKPDPKTLARVGLYVFGPCLIFNLIAKSTLSRSDMGLLILFPLVWTLIMWPLCWGIARTARFSRAESSAFLLSCLLVNAGNYGLSVNLLSFGQQGLERAGLIFVVTAVIANTLGIFIASQGHHGLTASLANVVKMPLIYAAALGFLVNMTSLELPQPLTVSIEITGAAAVPILLVLLGIQLSRSALGQHLKFLGLASIVKLGLGTGIAILVATLLGSTGLTRAVGVLDMSMPTAVTATILATEFDSRPDLVSGVAVVSTLLSIVSLTLLLSWLS